MGCGYRQVAHVHIGLVDSAILYIYIKHKGEWGHLGGQDERDEEIGMYII